MGRNQIKNPNPGANPSKIISMEYQGSTKKIVHILLEQCYKFGVRHVIISPGSRNAPLIISFGNHPKFKCYSIPDERSAAFYGLGMARQLSEPVALVCSSGTAVQNYAPALTEAYYQEIPLIAITADRPPYLIDQEDGQTIRQHKIFANHINYSTTLPIAEDEYNLTVGKDQIREAFQLALQYPKGPVHINIPFEEPLYEMEWIDFSENLQLNTVTSTLKNQTIDQEILNLFHNHEKILILCGVHPPDDELTEKLNTFSQKKNIPVLAPPTANIKGENVFNSIDLLFYAIAKANPENFTPDVLITIGGPVVSKVTKQHLRKYKPTIHIDIDINPRKVNTYKALTHQINAEPAFVLDQLSTKVKSKDRTFLDIWKNQSLQVRQKATSFLSETTWSDLKIYHTFLNSINQPINLHLANSTPVRYIEFFRAHPQINYYCNRGTSGIDGCTSTASGAAIVDNKPTFLITGDISFFYDSNAFWNGKMPPNLKVILVNNGGGNIFKVINGPSQTEQLNEFFVTNHKASAQKICDAFAIRYQSIYDNEQFLAGLYELLNAKKCMVLELITTKVENENFYRKLIDSVRL